MSSKMGDSLYPPSGTTSNVKSVPLHLWGWDTPARPHFAHKTCENQ